MPYLLDTQIVSFFLQARREQDLATAAGKVPCAIADEVHGELSGDPTRGTLFDRWFPTSHVDVISVVLGSPADALLIRLQTTVVTRRGRGERACIALAATDPTLVFAGMDKGACGSPFASYGCPGSG